MLDVGRLSWRRDTLGELIVDGRTGLTYKLHASLFCALFLPAMLLLGESAPDVSPVLPHASLSQKAETQTPTDKSTPAARFEMSGGLCLGAQGDHVCTMAVVVRRDGTYSSSGDEAYPKSGTCDPERLKALLDALDACDYEAARSHEPGPCWSGSDGMDPVVYFYPKQGVQRIADCETRIDWKASPFVELSAILEKDVRPFSPD